MSDERFFLDTVFVQALLNPRDPYYRPACALFSRVRAAREVWVTEAVFTEVANALAESHRAKVAEYKRFPHPPFHAWLKQVKTQTRKCPLHLLSVFGAET